MLPHPKTLDLCEKSVVKGFQKIFLSELEASGNGSLESKILEMCKVAKGLTAMSRFYRPGKGGQGWVPHCVLAYHWNGPVF